MKHWIALLALALALAAPVRAQQAPLDPARLAAAKDLMTAMGADAQFKVAVETMTKGMADMVRQRHSDKGGVVDEVMGALRDKFLARASEVRDLVAPLWAEKFSAAELKELTAFFGSPIGRKMIEAQPGIMQKSMQLGMQWGQRIGKEVEDEARKELEKRGIKI